MKIFVVIPAYNEETRIRTVIASLLSFPYEIVVVNDGSKDRTLAELQGLGGVHVLSHSINRGQGAALSTGTVYALRNGADIIVHFDADGQHQGHEIREMVDLLFRGNQDIVLGSRFLGKKANMPLHRKIVLKAGLIFIYFVSGLKLTDSQNGFRVMTREAAHKITITQDRMGHANEIMDEIGSHHLKYAEAPIEVIYDEYSLRKGQSSWNFIRLGFGTLWMKWTKK
ncbi:MAG: family 2 glycosyl transferase [Parcubacteria group bacterium Gr01-1014_18]|nr:MAG: family 2 glycosyl transferase [Parcubacteria group bacterium Greene0416_36]TSC81423.1 MAG: family 2 glycosyl transferase [Parcubacteria group bacterium Gr01-1014_18]TSC99021.1 MAG: family 2 glycosyl transferase [Parcubacteria group bacterium Greene1014_20]TSD07298.1 MAG: family 2 glycosyl transferase [Parcubacteria group bacterium Greene0714_2]